MSFDENVARKKSTRWVKAGQANYDGDDWSDDDDNYYGEENTQAPPLPVLPDISNDVSQTKPMEKDDDEYSYGTAPTPEIDVKRFQNISLDNPSSEQETLATLAEVDGPNSASPHDEYAQIIQDAENDEDEYVPQTSSRFQPFPEDIEEDRLSVKDEAEVPLAVEAVSVPSEGYVLHEPNNNNSSHDEDYEKGDVPYDSNVPTSVFAPFPSDSEQIVPSDEFVARDEEPTEEQLGNDDEPDILYSDEDDNTPVPDERQALGSELESMRQEARSPIAENLNFDDDEEEEFVPQTSRFQSTLDDDDEDDDEYVPRNGHFQSNFGEPTTPEKITSESEPGSSRNEPVIVDDEEVQGDDEEEEGDYEPPTESMGNLILRDVSPEAQAALTVPTIVEEPTSGHKSSDLTINAMHANTCLEPPPASPASYELSDTDTLHIGDPESPQERTVEPTRAGNPVGEVGNTSRLSRYEDDLHEHAYLGDLISTPNPDAMEIQQFEDQDEAELVDDEERKSPPRVRDSQFYTSVNDYFDDYTDESVVIKDTLAVTRTHSSGSLSTGGFSIRSETGYRSSKISDRTASFTGDRTASFTNQSVSDVQSTHGSTKGGINEKDSQLNPAMSINFGHWRPNTESFRDQFISGSSSTSAPPLPMVDNYSRNSRGEIIEDNASMAESIAPSYADSELKKELSNTSSEFDGNAGQRNTSMLSVLDDDEEQDEDKRSSKDLKDGTTYRTDSQTQLPVHIPLNTPDSSEPSHLSKTQYFHEHLSTSNTAFPEISKLPTRRPATYNMKQIATVDNPQVRISKYRAAREEEANVVSGLELWIGRAMEKVDMVSYKSPVTSHVKQAYAEAGQFSRKHNNINMGSFLNKKVLQETSSSAHSLAKGAKGISKGIFSRGKKMIKSER